MVHCECRGARLSLQLRVNKPTRPVGDCCVGKWARPLADNTFVRIGTGVRLLRHQIKSPSEQRRVILLVYNAIAFNARLRLATLPTKVGQLADFRHSRQTIVSLSALHNSIFPRIRLPTAVLSDSKSESHTTELLV